MIKSVRFAWKKSDDWLVRTAWDKVRAELGLEKKSLAPVDVVINGGPAFYDADWFEDEERIVVVVAALKKAGCLVAVAPENVVGVDFPEAP